MMKSTVAGGAFAITTVLLTVVVGVRAAEKEDGPITVSAAEAKAPSANAPADRLYGRVTTAGGEVYEGRLRFGGDEEALWSNYFNGYKAENPWTAHVPREERPRERLSWDLFGVRLAIEPESDVGRPFMARFGDIARMEAKGRDLWVTLRSGTVVHLDRYAADDYADGVRVWDPTRGTLDIGEREILSIDLLPAPGARPGAAPLYGTVRTRHGEFTGLLQWDREASLASDLLQGEGPDGPVSLPFDAVRSITRRSGEGALLTLRDGREIALNSTRQHGGNRGMYVDDPRYGRVLISWDAFEHVDFSPGDAAPAYHDFTPGRALFGTVITRSGRRYTGRLVYDLDESETTATLDAPAQGVDYTIPFSLIASINPHAARGVDARVTLRSGIELQLERSGDLAASNAGMLVFTPGQQNAKYLPWAEVEQVVLQ